MNGSKTISPPQEKKIVGSTPTKNEQKSQGLVILRGITTSQINQALKAKNPYPARVFLKNDCAICLSEKRQCFHSYNNTADIPVFFRIKDKESWIKPKIKTGSYLEVKGFFDNPKTGSFRQSFTALSYQLLNQEQAKVETYGK
ncbi:20308_t:CDS:1 [Funneliformis geosporum]|nr:20308_t:CDS:1 [Funneliformis geosporum]